MNAQLATAVSVRSTERLQNTNLSPGRGRRLLSRGASSPRTRDGVGKGSSRILLQMNVCSRKVLFAMLAKSGGAMRQ